MMRLAKQPSFDYDNLWRLIEVDEKGVSLYKGVFADRLTEDEADIVVQAVNAFDPLRKAIRDALDSVFNDGPRTDGWVHIHRDAVEELRSTLETAEKKGKHG